MPPKGRLPVHGCDQVRQAPFRKSLRPSSTAHLRARNGIRRQVLISHGTQVLAIVAERH